MSRLGRELSQESPFCHAQNSRLLNIAGNNNVKCSKFQLIFFSIRVGSLGRPQHALAEKTGLDVIFNMVGAWRLCVNVSYPESHGTKTFTGEQLKCYNVLTFFKVNLNIASPISG